MTTITNAAIQPETQTQPGSASKKVIWSGYIMSVVPALLLLLDGIMKLMKPAFVVEATVQLGYPERLVRSLGVWLLICTVIYLIRRTAVFGAILLTGYLGGAIATHARVGDPLFTMILPVIFATMLWGGLYLRDKQVRALVPWRSYER